MLMFQKLADFAVQRSWIDNPQFDVGKLPPCIGDECVSLVYMTVVSRRTKNHSREWIDHTVEYIRRNTDFSNSI